jgi:hypothetical protein
MHLKQLLTEESTGCGTIMGLIRQELSIGIFPRDLGDIESTNAMKAQSPYSCRDALLGKNVASRRYGVRTTTLSVVDP